MTHVHNQIVQFLNMCRRLIICIVVTRKVTHKVQLHLDWFIWRNAYISIVYTCGIHSATRN